MAYPELFTAGPFTFIANFHAQDLRKHDRPTVVSFMAEGVEQAFAITEIFEMATVGQYTSLSQRIGAHLAQDQSYPEGTRGTIKAYAEDANGGLLKIQVRNWNMAVSQEDFGCLLQGTPSRESPPLVAALSESPTNPLTGAPIVRVSHSLTDKPFSR